MSSMLLSKKEQHKEQLDQEKIELTYGVIETRCAKELLQGHTIDQIATTMGLSPSSVRFHLENLRQKLQVVLE